MARLLKVQLVLTSLLISCLVQSISIQCIRAFVIMNLTITLSSRNLLLQKLNPDISQYRDRRFSGTQEDFEKCLQESTTLYIGNLSFYTTEEQIYEVPLRLHYSIGLHCSSPLHIDGPSLLQVFSRAGDIKRIIMGLDKNQLTPCGFAFVVYYTREDAEDAVKYISGTIMDDRPVRVDFDWGFKEGRQFGRGRSGGQVRPLHLLQILI